MHLPNVHHIMAKWRLSLLKALQLQLFLSLISLPFLISWGLPISIMSVFSTILFGPFLTAFLLISSCIFFTQLLHIPNSFFVWLLEIVTTTWQSVLSIHQQWWLIGFTTPPLIVALCIIPCTLAILHNKYITTVYVRTTLLALLLIVTCFALKFFP